MTKLRLPLFALFLALGAFGLHACNTVEGAGKDVENTGEAIQDSAEDAEQEISE